MKKTIIAYILAGMLAVVGIGSLMQSIANTKANETVLSTEETTDKLWQQGIISYNDNYYQYKDGIKTYLIMGIDSMDPIGEEEKLSGGGQADALFLLIVDTKEKSWNILAINRNLMTQVEICDIEGESLGTKELQICLQHGFGDGKEVSCEKEVDTVSQTLWTLPIDGYVSINMGAIAMLNDALGGVTLTSMDDIDIEDEYVNIHIKKGEDITLQGFDAWGYLVWRDTSSLESATERLERQKQYIQAAYDKLLSGDVDKLQVLQAAFNTVQNYMVMDIPVVELAYQIANYERNLDEIYSIPGETTMGEEYAEFYMNKAETMDLLIDLYYNPVN